MTAHSLPTPEAYNQLLDIIHQVLSYKGERMILLQKRYDLPVVEGYKDEHERLTNEINRTTLEWDNACARLAVWLEDHATAEWYASRFLNAGLAMTKELAAKRSDNGY
jgi:hypothetical protein